MCVGGYLVVLYGMIFFVGGCEGRDLGDCLFGCVVYCVYFGMFGEGDEVLVGVVEGVDVVVFDVVDLVV